MRYKIMIADDDISIRKIVSSWLKKAGHSVVSVDSGSAVPTRVRESKPDLLLMDVILGDADGVELCRGLRADRRTKHIPVILISGTRIDEIDLITGLEGGADDYLFKPLKQKILIAKIEAVLRRFQAPKELEDTLKGYGLEINVEDRTVKVKKKAISLTRKEFNLLTTLLRKRGRVLSSEFLLESVWGYEVENYNDPHTVQVHISRLKKKLGKAFSSKITNIVGAGYRIS